MHAREIIERLGDSSLDIGFSGFDLFKESEFNIQKKITLVKKYNFGKANLVVAIPDPWIDVQTVADLEEIAFEFRDKKKKRLRVATKYPNLTSQIGIFSCNSKSCLLYTSPSPRDATLSRMPSSA